MPIPAGTRLGPYEVLAPLGAGGMGEVHRARDTRLGREVAIKVLPARLSADPDAQARFEREARLVSSLHHPNICTLFDVGGEAGSRYLVMELIEGESLAERLSRGRLPAPEVLKLGAQIADALDRAHRAGVVHRDLKPANVMMTKSGAKLVDFGLARLTLPETGGLLAEDGRTLTIGTERGAILGTVGYLAPEQVRGAPADARSDLFALGAMLYEAASGRRAFQGDTAVATLYAVLNDEPPPLAGVAPGVPPALERAVHVCLAKDPDERWQSALDLARELRWIAGAPHAVSAPAAAPPRGAAMRWAAGVLAALALVAAGAWLAERGARPGARVVSSIDPPPGTRLVPGHGPMALSADGSQLAFVAADSTGVTRLWVRSLASPDARMLAGTQGASSPFWSPDGRSLGFFAGGKLQRIELAGGPPQALADAIWPGGGSWGRDGTILFAKRMGSVINRVPASGGVAVSVSEAGLGPISDWQGWPQWLPDGRHFLFMSLLGIAHGPGSSLYVGDVAAPHEVRLVLRDVTHAVPAGHGHLLYVRDGALWSQRFDARTLRTTGEPIRVADQVVTDAELLCGAFSASPAGAAAYLHGGSAELSQLTWFDRAGRALGTVGPPAYDYSPRLSHDGRRVAVSLVDPTTGLGDIWTYDVARGMGDRFTFDPADEGAPVWSVDDARIYFMSQAGTRGQGDVHDKPVAGAGGEQVVLPSTTIAAPLDVTPDGRSLVVNLGHQSGSGAMLGSLVVLSLDARRATPWLARAFDDDQARLSSDGRWVAWASDETGAREVYVSRFPEGGEKWRVSTGGGAAPVWNRNGRELFYVTNDSRLMAVPFSPGPPIAIGAPRALFQTDMRPLNSMGAPYDVNADGQRFLVDRMLPGAASSSITLDQNWGAP